MKHMKKMMALVIAMVMIIGTMSIGAFAADTPQGGLTVDPEISVTGLQQNDSVTFYKVLKWDNGWKVADGFTLTDAELATVVGDKDTPGAISSTLAGALATQAAAASGAKTYTATSWFRR